MPKSEVYKMSKMYKRIDELCRQRHVSITKMCMLAGVSRSSLTELKMGRINTLKAETLDKIAKSLGTSVEYLLHGDESHTNEKPPYYG